MEDRLREELLRAQRNEVTEHEIYTRLAGIVKDPQNREVLERIGRDELRHSRVLRKHTGQEVRPVRWKVWLFYLVARVFGLTFGIKLMELGEDRVEVNYRSLGRKVPDVAAIADDEEEHEQQLIDALDEERLKYTGSVIRGLNDALVELTGALAGFTLAFREARLIAMAGLITGISAALSMAGSEYLATRAGPGGLSPGKASFYTGSAYACTVLVLIAPYLLLANVYVSIGLVLIAALLIIGLFNFYIAVASPSWVAQCFDTTNTARVSCSSKYRGASTGLPSGRLAAAAVKLNEPNPKEQYEADSGTGRFADIVVPARSGRSERCARRETDRRTPHPHLARLRVARRGR